MALTGAAQPVAASDRLQMVDPKTIMYSVPTISDDLAPVDAVIEKPGAQDPMFHEDDWCQVEFLPQAYLPEVQRMLKEYKVFEAANRHKTTVRGKEYSVWRNTYVRKVSRQSLISGPEPVERLEKILGAKAGPAPVLFSSNSLTGRVKEGFTIALGGNVLLYGYRHAGVIPVLGASIGGNPDDKVLTTAFGKLNSSDGLILVDWRSQFVLTSVTPAGKVQAWQP